MSRASYEREVALVYLLAGNAARRAALRKPARELVAHADFARLTALLNDRRLLPLIGSRAIETAPDMVPDAFRDAVRGATARARAQSLAVENTTRTATRELAGAGIRALPLKGPLLAADVHGDTGLRETNDADVLVARKDLQRAAGVLRGLGFASPTEAVDADGLPDLHLTMEHTQHRAIELHWRVHWDDDEFSQRMLERATEAPDGMLRAQADDLAASLLLYYARDGFHGVRMAADLAAWWDRNAQTMPPRFLEQYARTYPRLAPSLTAAARAVQDLAGVPALSWLGDAVAQGRRVEIAARFADWTQAGDRDQLAANISLVSALLASPAPGAAFVRRELSLPGAAPAGNVLHAAKMTGRFVLALWKVRGGRRWAYPPATAAAAA